MIKMNNTMEDYATKMNAIKDIMESVQFAGEMNAQQITFNAGPYVYMGRLV